MSDAQELVNGLLIFIAHAHEDKYATYVCAGAEHDIIYGADSKTIALTAAEKETLEKNNWHIDSETGSWAKFV